jgi:hypothetical protein
MDNELKAILVSRQSEAYKQTKPIIISVGRNDKDVIKSAVTVIRTILTGSEYKVYSKLNAMRVSIVRCSSYETATRQEANH